jgi:hypothetical protein
MISVDSEKQGIDLERCNAARIRVNLRTAKIAPAAKGSIAELAQQLNAHYEKQLREQRVEMAQCDRCRAVGPAAFDACPFCGELNGAPSSSAIGGGSDSEADSSLAAARVEEKGLIVPAGQNVFTRPIVRVEKLRPIATENELEVAVGNIQRYKRTFSENCWDIGNELNRIAEESSENPALWRLRMDEDGKAPSYTTFKAFLRAEVGFSARMADGLMYAAKTYQREQLALTGMAKLEIVLNAPPKAREKLLAAAGTTPVRQLREKVRELNIAAGRGEAQRKGKETLKAKQLEKAKSHEKAEEKADGLTTIVLAKPKGQIWLYRRTKNVEEKPVRTTQLSDNYGWIDAQNGMQILLSVLKMPDGKGWKISYEARRTGV